jgi:hypothetical protein
VLVSVLFCNNFVTFSLQLCHMDGSRVFHLQLNFIAEYLLWRRVLQHYIGVSASSRLSWYLITNQRINTDMNLVKIIFIIKLIYKHHSRYPTLLVHHHSSSIIAWYHHTPFLRQRSHYSSRHWTKNSLSLIFPI